MKGTREAKPPTPKSCPPGLRLPLVQGMPVVGGPSDVSLAGTRVGLRVFGGLARLPQGESGWKGH